MKEKYYIENDMIYWYIDGEFGYLGSKIRDFIYYAEHVNMFNHDIRYKIYLEIIDQYPEFKI